MIRTNLSGKIGFDLGIGRGVEFGNLRKALLLEGRGNEECDMIREVKKRQFEQ